MYLLYKTWREGGNWVQKGMYRGTGHGGSYIGRAGERKGNLAGSRSWEISKTGQRPGMGGGPRVTMGEILAETPSSETMILK